MSHIQTQQFEESKLEAQQEMREIKNPLSFKETIKIINRVNRAIYGVGLYSEADTEPEIPEDLTPSEERKEKHEI